MRPSTSTLRAAHEVVGIGKLPVVSLQETAPGMRAVFSLPSPCRLRLVQPAGCSPRPGACGLLAPPLTPGATSSTSKLHPELVHAPMVTFRCRTICKSSAAAQAHDSSVSKMKWMRLGLQAQTTSRTDSMTGGNHAPPMPGATASALCASTWSSEWMRDRSRSRSMRMATLTDLQQTRHFARKSANSRGPQDHDTSDDNNRADTPGKNGSSASFMQRVLGVGAAGYAAVKVFPGLKIAIPILKMSKMGPLLSLALSSLAYTFVFGWQYGLGMISLIFVHEMGHALMMKYLKVPVGPMVFLPFMGAAVEMKKMPKNATHEALIGIAGPILGSLASVVPFAYGLQTGSQLSFALANWGFLINLFNLMPVGQMDGGRILGALHPGFLVLGLVGNAGLIYVMPSAPMLYLTLLMGSFSTYQRLFPSDASETPPPEFYAIPAWQKGLIAGGYFGLVTALILAMQVNDHFRKSPQQLRAEQRRSTTANDTTAGFATSYTGEGGAAETIWSYLDHVDKNYC